MTRAPTKKCDTYTPTGMHWCECHKAHRPGKCPHRPKSGFRRLVSLLTFGILTILCSMLANSALATGSITLGWSPAASCVIHYGTATNSCTNKVVMASPSTNATVTGLAQGSMYYFQAFLVAADGTETPWSDFASYRVPLNYLQPVFLLVQVTQTTTDILRGWTAVATNVAVIAATQTNQFFRDFLMVNHTNRMMFQ